MIPLANSSVWDLGAEISSNQHALLAPLHSTPFLFKTVWAFVSPFLEERTRKKIRVIG